MSEAGLQSIVGLAGLALGSMIVVGVTHEARNVYLETFTDRKPVPFFVTQSVLPQLDIQTKLVAQNEYTDRYAIRVTNNSTIPVWKIKVKCQAAYAGDHPGIDDRSGEYVIFADEGVMPGQTKTDMSASVQSGAFGEVSHSCSVTKIDTPVSWWRGFPIGLG